MKKTVILDEIECLNLLDALKEWDDAVSPKELEDHEFGLNSERYENLIKKLKGE
jgi:hypothetical protein